MNDPKHVIAAVHGTPHAPVAGSRLTRWLKHLAANHLTIKNLVIAALVPTALLGCKPEPPALEAEKAAPAAVTVHENAAAGATPNSLSEMAPADPSTAAMGLPAGHPPIGGAGGSAAAPPAAAPEIGGTVDEVIDAGKYVYLKLKGPDGPVWAATLKSDVKPGQVVMLEGASLMENFRSPTLNRSFERIWFGSLAGAKPAAPAAAPTAAEPVAPATGDGATTIGALFAAPDTLAGKTIRVRGRVTKFNAGIMGRNWLHLQDGTGDAAKATHDLTVTTDGSAVVGSEVTISGTVVLNQDFGAGYTYPVLVEKATITPAASAAEPAAAEPAAALPAAAEPAAGEPAAAKPPADPAAPAPTPSE